MTLISLERNLPTERGGETMPESGAEKFISFEIGGELCCVAASGVAEVVHPIEVAKLPNSPNWLLGLGAYRGEPVAVIDPRIIAHPAADSRSKAKVIVFRTRPNETQFALPIDRLHEMIIAPTSETRPHEYMHNGQSVRFIEHERLFEGFDGGRRLRA
jgi:chemotaxis signal transduction protein